MHISFSPQRRDDSLLLEKSSGNRLRINGELFNFNSLNDGDSISAGVVPSDWIVGPVERIDGEVCLTLILPHGANPEQHMAFPDPIVVQDDGLIGIPFSTWSELISSVQIDGGTEETFVVHHWGYPDETKTNFIPDEVEEPANVEPE